MKLQKYEDTNRHYAKLIPFGYSHVRCLLNLRKKCGWSETLYVRRIDRYGSDNNDDNSFSLDHETPLLRDVEANARIRVAEYRNAGIALAPASNKRTDIVYRNGRKSETYKKNGIFYPAETRNSKSFLVFNKNVAKTHVVKRRDQRVTK